MKLKGKTALVVGASRGIGLAIAKELAEEGAHTILAARSMKALEEQAGELRKKGLSAEPRQLDMANPESIRSLSDALDAPDILINVAGTNIRKPFEQYTKQEYDQILQ